MEGFESERLVLLVIANSCQCATATPEPCCLGTCDGCTQQIVVCAACRFDLSSSAPVQTVVMGRTGSSSSSTVPSCQTLQTTPPLVLRNPSGITFSADGTVMYTTEVRLLTAVLSMSYPIDIMSHRLSNRLPTVRLDRTCIVLVCLAFSDQGRASCYKLKPACTSTHWTCRAL